MYRLLVLGLLTSFYILSARAEVLYGVVPYQTLGDIKKLFPQAELERAVGPDSRKGAVVLKTAAPDSTGTLYLGFLDSRPGSRESAKKAEILINDAKKVLRGTLRYPGFIELINAFKEIGYIDETSVLGNNWL